MTEQVDLDALIAEARGKITGTWQGDDETPLTADEIGQLQDLYERLADALESTLAELRQERERAAELEGAYNSAVERHRLAAEKRDEYQQLYGDMADDERRARVALRRAEERADEAESRVAFAAAIVSGDAVFDRYQELDEALAALSRAEETIARVLSALDPSTGDGAALDEARTILNEYGKQKGADHANVSEVPERLNCPGEVKVKVQSEPTGALSDYLRGKGFNPNRMGNWDTGSGVGLAREAFLAGWSARERGV